VYQTPSGYTTATGPAAQRSRQPALFTRTLPGPASPSALTLRLAAVERGLGAVVGAAVFAVGALVQAEEDVVR
jgi:hypothetical protein